MTSFRPRSPFVEDQTQLSNAQGVSDQAELYFQFVQYRWRIATARLTALKQMLNGEKVHEWTLKSPLLGTNLRDIQQFLRDTGSQMCMPIPDCATTVSSKVNAIDLTMACPEHVAHLHSTGLRLAIDSLRSGLHEQKTARGFDWYLVQTTFGFVDKILLQLMQ